jgi:ketosteroid isomerase-like protein
MKTVSSNNDNMMQISKLLYDWADSTQKGENDDVLSNHSSDVLIFDVLTPLQYKGAEKYKESWGEWQPEYKEESLFEIHELDITTSETVAFAHGLIKCGIEPKIDWVRATFCLLKTDEKWKIIHQHISMPISK